MPISEEVQAVDKTHLTPVVSLSGAELVQVIGEIEKLKREIEYLRHYGNKDCTHMADEAMEAGEMDDG